MLELIFQGFLEWAYGLALECWQYFSTALLDIMSMDFAYLKSHAPVVDEIMQILLAVGWALLIGNLVFQALKSMAVGLGFEGEDPKLLFARTFVFAFLLLASPQICEIGLSMTSKIIELLQIPDAVNVTFVDESVFGAIGAAWLLVIIFGIIVMFKVFKLLLEIAERYVILAMSVRDMDVLRLLCWCQNVRPDDLSSISTETERENLITLGLIKRHQRSDTLLLTNSGRAFLQAALEGDVPNLTLSYHDAAIERRVRLSSLMMTAYHAGINVFTITANSLAEPSTLFITAITRSRGHNPWGSARVGAIAHLGSTYYAVHYIYSGIGRMAVNDELAAFHNHTNFGKDTQRAFLFAGASYADIMEELKARDEKRDAKLIRYSEAYRGLHYPVHLLSCDETGARQLQIMAVPDYRVKISKLMLRSAYRPPPEDAPAWDATYQNRPFVIGADMNLRRIDAAIASAKKRGCLPISLAALDAQGDAVLLRRYKDTGYAVIYKVTESVLTELFGHPPSLYLPPCTQYLTKKGAVVDAPLIQVDRKDRGSPRK